MTRLIDADALAKVKFHGYPEIEITPSDVNAEAYKRGWNDAIDAIIESGPSIDAVPVIRCKDCKYNLNNDRLFADPDPIMTYAWCNTEAFQENDFCSKGKRREE